MPDTAPIHDRILQTLENSGARYQIHTHAASVTFQDAADYLHFPLEQLLKTVAFKVKEGPWVLATLRGRDRVDYKKLAACLGVNRTRLMALHPEQVLSDLGYPLGGVAPFHTNERTRLIFDTKAVDLGIIFCGSGRNDHTLEIDARQLVEVSGGEIAAISTDD